MLFVKINVLAIYTTLWSVLGKDTEWYHLNLLFNIIYYYIFSGILYDCKCVLCKWNTGVPHWLTCSVCMYHRVAEMCGSKKYPYTPMEGHCKFRWGRGGGLNSYNFKGKVWTLSMNLSRGKEGVKKPVYGGGIVRFQKISISSPWKVIRNSEGGGGLKCPNV